MRNPGSDEQKNESSVSGNWVSLSYQWQAMPIDSVVKNEGKKSKNGWQHFHSLPILFLGLSRLHAHGFMHY